MRFAASRRKPARIYAYGNTRWQQSCSHSTAICNRRFKKRIELHTQEQPLVAEHRGGTHSRQKRPQPQPPHTRGSFHRRLQPLHTEKHKVSCSGFLPKTKPIEHLCSHSTAICNRRFKKLIELRTGTEEQPLVAEHRGGTHSRQKRPPQLPHTHEVAFIAACSHFTRKNARFRAPPSSPTSPMQHPCSHYNAFWTSLHQRQSFCDVLLCSVKSHTALHQGQFFCDVLLCSVKCHTTLHQGQSFCDVLLCSVKSHTALHQGQFFCDVLLCSVKSHTTLHQGQSFCDVLLCSVK